jgi:hypothetical protein
MLRADGNKEGICGTWARGFSFRKTAVYQITATTGWSLPQQKDQPRGAQEHKKGDDRAVEQTEPRLFRSVCRDERGMNKTCTALSVHIERNFSHAGL